MKLFVVISSNAFGCVSSDIRLILCGMRGSSSTRANMSDRSACNSPPSIEINSRLAMLAMMHRDRRAGCNRPEKRPCRGAVSCKQRRHTFQEYKSSRITTKCSGSRNMPQYPHPGALCLPLESWGRALVVWQ